MSTPFLGQLILASFNFPPKGYAFCNGQLLAINQNQALFSILGTTYGGDGQTNFGLPNLQGRVPMHMGNGFNLGQQGGSATVTLDDAEIPAHTHTAVAGANAADQLSPASHVWAASGTAAFGPPDASLGDMDVTSSNAGSSQPHENLSPYLVISFCIALQGIFPSQN